MSHEWNFHISTGLIFVDGMSIGAQFYSGNGVGLNNVSMERIEGVGPIPRGGWTIDRWDDVHGTKGPIVAVLSPNEGTNTFGRSEFLIHGDNGLGNHSASHGCIILSRPWREKLRETGLNQIIVL